MAEYVAEKGKKECFVGKIEIKLKFTVKNLCRYTNLTKFCLRKQTREDGGRRCDRFFSEIHAIWFAFFHLTSSREKAKLFEQGVRGMREEVFATFPFAA